MKKLVTTFLFFSLTTQIVAENPETSSVWEKLKNTDTRYIVGGGCLALLALGFVGYKWISDRKKKKEKYENINRAEEETEKIKTERKKTNIIEDIKELQDDKSKFISLMQNFNEIFCYEIQKINKNNNTFNCFLNYLIKYQTYLKCRGYHNYNNFYGYYEDETETSIIKEMKEQIDSTIIKLTNLVKFEHNKNKECKEYKYNKLKNDDEIETLNYYKLKKDQKINKLNLGKLKKYQVYIKNLLAREKDIKEAFYINTKLSDFFKELKSLSDHTTLLKEDENLIKNISNEYNKKIKNICVSLCSIILTHCKKIKDVYQSKTITRFTPYLPEINNIKTLENNVNILSGKIKNMENFNFTKEQLKELIG